MIKPKHLFAEIQPDLEYNLLTKYNITLEQYEQMNKGQDGKCAICGKLPKNRKSWHVDHDHVTGKVRGLLCASCNQGLGFFKDSPEILSKAKIYLQKHIILVKRGVV